MKNFIEILQGWSSTPFEPSGYSDIEDLEEASGGPLPQAYVGFLRAAGRGLGALEVGEAEMRLPQLLERYAIVSWTPPFPLICIGIDQAPLGTESYYLDRSRPCGDDDCAVLRFRLPQGNERWQDLARVEFVSLRELLLFWGFVSLRVPQLGTQAFLVAPDGAPLTDAQQSAIFDALEHWPVARVPHMEVCRGYDGEALAALVHRDPRDQRLLSVRVAAKDAHELRIREAMLEDLGLERWR